MNYEALKLGGIYYVGNDQWMLLQGGGDKDGHLVIDGPRFDTRTGKVSLGWAYETQVDLSRAVPAHVQEALEPWLDEG